MKNSRKSLFYSFWTWVMFLGLGIGTLVALGILVEFYLALTDYGFSAFLRLLPNWLLTIGLSLTTAYIGWKKRLTTAM